MAFCVHCGTQVADGTPVCPNCGQSATQPSAGSGAAAQPAPAPVPAASSAAAGGLDENIAGMLAYFTIIPAIVFLVIEPYNRSRFVRFHAFQCIFGVVAIIVIDIALGIAAAILHVIPGIGWMMSTALWWLWSLAVLALWVLVVIKAYQHEIYKLPLIGDMAERQAGAGA